MRNLLSLMLVAVMGIILLGSCERLGISSPGDNYDTSDSAMVAEYVTSVVNPSVMDVTEALSLKKSMLEEQAIDSAFLSLSDNTIRNVVTVLLKKNSFVKKKDIVEAYRANSNIYDNLPTDPKASSVDKTATDLGTRQNNKNDSSNFCGRDNIISNSYSFRTDTVAGKPIRVKIQTIESYE